LSELRVLVVDDNDSFRGLMATHLSRSGFRVDVAVDGLEALELIRRAPKAYGVMVTDLMMPRLNGLELVREARRLDPNLQIVVITAATTLEMAIAALRAEGAYDYLLKPLEAIGELTVAVERAAAHRELQIEQLRLRDQLAQQAAQFQTVVYYSSDAILAADSRDVLTVCNPAATRLLGQDAPIGQAAHSMLPALLATLLVSWRSKPEPEAQTFEVRWPTHRQLQSVALAPLPGNGTRPGWVMVLRDVSHLAE